MLPSRNFVKDMVAPKQESRTPIQDTDPGQHDQRLQKSYRFCFISMIVQWRGSLWGIVICCLSRNVLATENLNFGPLCGYPSRRPWRRIVEAATRPSPSPAPTPNAHWSTISCVEVNDRFDQEIHSVQSVLNGYGVFAEDKGNARICSRCYPTYNRTWAKRRILMSRRRGNEQTQRQKVLR